jgi:general secretion pathway protein H
MRIFATDAKLRERGFTLLELLIVLAVMALIAAVVLPNFQLPGFATNSASAARQIASGLADARQKAIFSNRETRILFDIENRTFSVGAGQTVSLKGIRKLTLLTTERDIVDENRGEIRFFPDGSAGGGEISLVDDSGTTTTVRVNWLTGRISFDG